jgi:hypothetical protein
MAGAVVLVSLTPCTYSACETLLSSLHPKHTYSPIRCVCPCYIEVNSMCDPPPPTTKPIGTCPHNSGVNTKRYPNNSIILYISRDKAINVRDTLYMLHFINDGDGYINNTDIVIVGFMHVQQ